jgi:predicted RNase H-like nuclease
MSLYFFQQAKFRLTFSSSLRRLPLFMSLLVVGIDAAWTAHHPAGVALVKIQKRDRPRLLRVARSYEEFCGFCKNDRIDWSTKVHGSAPNIPALLAVCERIAGVMPTVIALDIPLGPQLITRRRAADRMVTSAYLKRKAGTHSPTATRPGPISQILFEQLCSCGFKWLPVRTALSQSKNSRVFIEAYPHPAIIELLNLNERLKYKVSKLQKYWPDLEGDKRWAAVAQNLARLRTVLDKRLAGVADCLPSAQSLIKNGAVSRLKGYEDALDAIVCAWIGCEFLAGRCVAYGDEKSAIWLPKPA